jgi:hypothetical protein
MEGNLGEDPLAKTGTKVRVPNTVPTGVADQKGDHLLSMWLMTCTFKSKAMTCIRTTIDLTQRYWVVRLPYRLPGKVVLTIPAGTQLAGDGPADDACHG